MTPIAYPILRTGRTDIDGSVVVTPSGGSTGTPIVAADLVNGFTPITVSFAAGEMSKPVSFPITDDSAVEGTETYRLTMSNPQPSGAFPSGAFVEGTVGDNDTGGGGGTAPTLTYVYGPKDGAADSGVQEIQSTQQQCGRTWQAGAPSWKVHLGETGGGTNAATALRIVFSDGAGKLTYMPFIDNSVTSSRSVDLAYTGANPSASEPYTFIVSDTTSIRYYCAATIDRANPRLLATIPYSIWDNTTFWGDQNIADRVPGKQAESNAELQLANGIYAARLGAIQ